MTVLAIAGGVGGAKLTLGLTKALCPDQLIIAVNTGDDFKHLGLQICPDLDTVMYSLAGVANPETGWGIYGDTWETISALTTLGGPTWFRLGDRDIATHLERTRRLELGQPLSQVTTALAEKFGVEHVVTPASDDKISTIIQTTNEEISFQEYFVERQCKPKVKGFRFEGAENAKPSPVLRKCFRDDELELIVICPSNPYVSIGPILAIPEISRFLMATETPVVAVSPIVGGQALKGPAAKIMRELGIEVSCTSIAKHYNKILSKFYVDTTDVNQVKRIEALGIKTRATNTIMDNDQDKLELAIDILNQFGIPF